MKKLFQSEGIFVASLAVLAILLGTFVLIVTPLLLPPLGK